MKTIVVKALRKIVVEERGENNNIFPVVIDCLNTGKLNVKKRITHRFHFTEIKDVFQLIENPNVENGKVVLLFD